MNLFKISLRNIKKSMKDYSVYFMTLIIGVAIFYMFNSISHQNFMSDLSSSAYEIVKLLRSVIEAVSVVVAFVLGLLMVYANHFLIRRRKKEFGVYMMLGMGKNEVSKIIIGETLIVGIISLVVGIIIGIFGSQFLSIAVGKMFLADVSKYSFLFSGAVVLKTIINFAVIFLIVLIFNTATISKYDLIDLLQANKKGEKHVMKNTVLSVILFLVSIATLGIAYYNVSANAQNLDSKGMMICIAAGTIATFVFFWSLSGFLLQALKKNKKLYYSKLNLFVIRQFCAGVNSSSLSMALISLMLFMAISAFSVGFAMKDNLNESIERLTPVDVTMEWDSKKANYAKFFEKEGFGFDQWLEEDYVECPIYSHKDICLGTTFGSAIDKAKEQFPVARWDVTVNTLKLSDYNRIAKKLGNEELKMADDEYAYLCDVEIIRDFRDKGLAEGSILKVGNVELKPVQSECIYGFMLMSHMAQNMGVVIVPDAVVENKDLKFKKAGTYLAGNFQKVNAAERKQIEEKLEKIMDPHAEINYEDMSVEMMYSTQTSVRQQSSGMAVLVVFLVVYLGLVFIISCAAILALKALSDSIDSANKYEVLSKIGAEQGMMDRSLFVQNLIHFGLPLVVAIVHSVFGLQFAKSFLEVFGLDSVVTGALTTAVAMLVVYGGYVVATYLGCKRIINTK